MREYHTQRATEGGLLITEATFIGATTIPITSDLHPFGDPYEIPQELNIPEIKEIIEQFKQAAINSIEFASFDGVKIHSANGYLLDQFINMSSNKRTHIYGGSIENRSRFTLEVVDVVSKAITPQRTATRFSPWYNDKDIEDNTPYEMWGYITEQLQERYPNLAYLHFVDPRHQTFEEKAYADLISNSDETLDPFRNIWKGTFISVSGYSYGTKLAFAEAERTKNLIAFGRHFIANPDLVQRIRNNWSFNKYDLSTFYTQGAKGYINYPFYKA